jgi:putative NADPH-quinone reductase
MRNAILPAVLLGAALFATGAWSDERVQNADLESRVADLETQLSESRRALEQLSRDQAELRATDQAVLAYLGRQAAAANTMQTVLDSVEAKGFTAGINPDSRTTLLAGLRTLFTHTADVPKAGAQQTAPANGR